VDTGENNYHFFIPACVLFGRLNCTNIILKVTGESTYFFTITRLNNENIQQLERSLQGKFENHFDPKEIEQLARDKKFVQRDSKLNGTTFLSLIIFNSNSLHDESLNDLTIALNKHHGVDISKQGLDVRFNSYAVQFLTAALENLLQQQLAEKISFSNCLEFKRILIKDSVCFQVDESLAKHYPGSGGSGSKANVRIQFEYNLLDGKIVDLSLNAFNDQDAKNSVLTLDIVNEGDLIIRDLAYMHLESLQGIVERIGHFLCRLNTQAKVYQEQDGKMIALDFSAIIRAMRKHNVQQIEKTVFIGKKQELQVRLFIYLLPEAVYNKRMRKANRTAKSKGHQVSKEYKARAGLNLFITSAPKELISIETAWQIYTLRWQIELTFKVWKSCCKIDKVKKVKKDRLECYILSKLLLIVLCWRVAWFTGMLLRRHHGKKISYFKAFKTLMHDVGTLRKIFVDGTLAVESYLADFLTLSSKKHLFEKKKGRENYSPEVLFRSLTILEDGKLIAI
jgi:hypothetical protein